MSWLSVALPPSKRELPATLEGATTFCVKTAALSRPAAPMAQPVSDAVLITGADGGVVIYPPSDKLAILASERVKRRKR
jgi:hypothetical protein